MPQMDMIMYHIMKNAYEAQIPIDYAWVERRFGKRCAQDLQAFASFEDFCQQYYLMSGSRLCLDFEYPEVEYALD